MGVTRVDDADDPRVADYRNVPDPALVAERGLFVAEGRLVVRRLLAGSRFAARSVMVTEPALAAIDDVLDAHPGLPVYVVPQAVMNTITGFNIHRGCLAIGVRPAAAEWPALAHPARRLVVLERVGDADNVGSTFRNAAAFGVDAVLLGPGCADPLYRKAIRTSMGAALTLPFAGMAPWPDALRALRDAGFATIALTPAASAPALHDVVADLGDSRLALLLGHEGDGLTASALTHATHTGRIPMATGVDSLNVATAAAVALYAIAAVSGSSRRRGC